MWSYNTGSFYENTSEQPKRKMDSRSKHPFAITCRKCGSNDVSAIAYEYHELVIRCRKCNFTLECGAYHTLDGDYSDC